MYMKNSFFSIRRLCLMAMMVAMQVLFSRYLGIQVSSTLRVSLETIPIMLSGLWLGPLAGALVALVSDVLGTVLSGYGIYFIYFAVGPITVGIVSGFLGKFLMHDAKPSMPDACELIFALILTECFTSILYGTLASQWYFTYISQESPSLLTYFAPFLLPQSREYTALLVARIPVKLITIPVDAVLSALIYRFTWNAVTQSYLQNGGEPNA